MGVSRLIVLDTNVFVSGLMKMHDLPPVQLVDLVADGLLRVSYDVRMLDEYREVLSRPQFNIDLQKRASLFQMITTYGFDVDPPHADLDFPDESDRPFYEVAELCFSPLVTGNKRHFPDREWILSPAEYIHALRCLDKNSFE